MKYLLFDSKWIEWICRILISLNLVIPGFTYSIHFYPLNVLMITLLGFWLYLFKIKIISLLFLLFALYINYEHWGMPYSE